jgi:hypothetical protein
MWCISEIDATYRERMYDVLDLYAEPYDSQRPIIGFDEKPKQLLEDSRYPIPMKPGSSEKYDYEYIHRGKANIFMAIEPKAGKRTVRITERRAKQDFAKFIKFLVDRVYPNANIVRIVLDNLNTHFVKSFYDTYDKEEADRIMRRVEFHYTPKHASWLNIAEIEINVMDIECTGRRIADENILAREVRAWANLRNNKKKKIKWKFTRQDADEKLSKYYVT